MLSTRYTSDGSSERTVQMLIDAGANLNSKSGGGYTALMLSSRHSSDGSSERTVQMLIENYADPNIQDNNGNTALMFASKDKSEKICRLLLDYHADINIMNNLGISPTKYIHADMLNMYLDYVKNKAFIDGYKKAVYYMSLINIPVQNQMIRFKPGNYGCKISKYHFDGEFDINIMSYLSANPDNLLDKVQEYLAFSI